MRAFHASFRRHGLLTALVALIALGAGTVANALSIGDARLQSALGQPLRATIPLEHLGTLVEQDLIIARGGDSSGSSNVQMALSTDAKGQVSVLLKTAAPLNEPLLELVLEVRWPSGRAVKQFTLLLDPPPR